LFALYRPTRYFAANSQQIIAKIKSIFKKSLFRYRNPVFFRDSIFRVHLQSFALLSGSFAVLCATFGFICSPLGYLSRGRSTNVLNIRNKMDDCATHSGVTFTVSVKTPDPRLNNLWEK